MTAVLDLIRAGHVVCRLKCLILLTLTPRKG
jgi:hypothetical protein